MARIKAIPLQLTSFEIEI